MNPIGELFRDHWATILVVFALMVVVGLASITGLILFTRWVVHIEFTRLTTSLHDDIGKIDAKLALIARSDWTDISLARKFADVDSVLADNQRKVDEAMDWVKVLEDEQNAIRQANKDREERILVLEAWKKKIADLNIIRSGF